MSQHPEAPIPEDVTPQDSRDIVNFLDLLLMYLYDLPKQIENFRQRKVRQDQRRVELGRMSGAKVVKSSFFKLSRTFGTSPPLRKKALINLGGLSHATISS